MQNTNDAKLYQIEAYPKVLEAIRTAIGHDKILSIAVPGKQGTLDCIAVIVRTNKSRGYDGLHVRDRSKDLAPSRFYQRHVL
jgi:hypothetical protein